MFIIDFFLDSLHKYPYALRIPFYIFLLLFGFLVTVSGIIFLETGEIVLNPNIIFSKDLLLMLVRSNEEYLYTALFGEHILLIGLFFWMHYKINTRANCSIQQVHIEEIAVGWLDTQRTKKMIIQEHLINNPPLESLSNSTQQNINLNYKDNEIKKFYQNIIQKEVSNASNEEITMITELLSLLDNQGDIPSVVSYCEKDPEKSYKNNAITEDGKTSFDVLRKINLKDHSLNVAYEIYRLIKERSRNNYGVLFAPAIISALAHDIGKIRKMKELSNKISPEIFTEQPHYMISKIYFMRMYPHYKMLRDVVEAIELHHIHKLQSGGTLAYLLVAADKGARQLEIDNFFKELSNKEKPSGREKIADSVLTKANLFDKDILEKDKVEENNNFTEKRLLVQGIKKDKITRTWGRMKFDTDIKEFFLKSQSGFIAMIGIDDIIKYNASEKNNLFQQLSDYIYAEIRGISEVYRYDENIFVVTFDGVNSDAIKTYLEEIRNRIDYKSDVFKVSICAGEIKNFTTYENIIESVKRGLLSSQKEGGNRVTYALNKKNTAQKKKRRLASIADIDLMGDYKKEVKDENNIEEFDLEEFENDILLNLKTKINKSNSIGYQKYKIESISYDDIIVFSFKTIEDAIQQTLGYEKDCSSMTRFFIKEYRKQGKIGLIDVENNFFTSKFCLENKNGENIEYVGVPVFLKSFDMSELELKNSKKQDSHLQDLTVKKISECK